MEKKSSPIGSYSMTPKEDLIKLAKSVLEQIDKLENPDIKLPIRTLSNIYFDEKHNLIRLGGKMSHRTYLNVAHTRKFMQTLMVAAECKKIIDQGVTISIRDLYYALKRTIPETKENTFEEQEESVWPDESLLVRIKGELKILPGSEVLEFAEKTGRKVYDKDGKVRIADVDLKVCAFDKNQKIGEHKVLMVMRHPSKESVKIKTSSGREVKITPYHSLFTMGEDGKPKSIEVNSLKAGDWVALPRKIEIEPNHERINVLNRLMEKAPQKVLDKLYLKGEGIEDLINGIPKEKIKQYAKGSYKNRWSDVAANWKHWKTLPVGFVKESKIDLSPHLDKLKISSVGGRHQYNCLINKDEDMGFVLGLLVSEGSHTAVTRKREERHISVSNKSKKLLEEFSSRFEISFGCRVGSRNTLKSKDGTYKINIGYNMLGYILEHVFDYKAERAWDKRIPGVLLDAPEPCIKSFIRAFRLGDGSVYRQKCRIRFHTTSRHIVNGLGFLLLRLGIFSNIYEYRRKSPSHTAYEVRVESREYVKLLSEITSDFEEFGKKSQISGDRIPHMGNLIQSLRKSCRRLDEKIYKEFDFYGIEKGRAVSRPVLEKAIRRIEQFSPDKEILETVKEASQSDIYWDQVVRIEDCGQPPYTIDVAVNPTQNFIGGYGFLVLHNSDPILEDLEAALNTLRERLHLKADRKGYLAGSLMINDSGDEIDASKMGSSGWAIPSNVEPEIIKLDNRADFVLVIEKDAVWQRLNEDKFWRKHNCIIITGKGQPDRGTRRIINRLHNEFKLPVYVLTDSDFWGYYIYSVIKQGSINLSFLSDRLGTPSAKFIGLTTRDVEKFKIPKNVTIKLNQGDIKRGNELLNYIWFKPKEWQDELNNMLKVGYKLELEALTAKGVTFISEKYLPQKIKEKDFLP